MPSFYWIALQNVQGVVELKGPFNTQAGRDSEFVKNNDFWSSSGIVAQRFETLGKNFTNARSTALQVLEQSGAPTQPSTPIQVEQHIPTTPVPAGIPTPQPLNIPARTQQEMEDDLDQIENQNPREVEIDVPGIDLEQGLLDVAQDERASTLGTEQGINDILDEQSFGQDITRNNFDAFEQISNQVGELEGSPIEGTDEALKDAFQKEINFQRDIADEESLLNTPELNREKASQQIEIEDIP